MKALYTVLLLSALLNGCDDGGDGEAAPTPDTNIADANIADANTADASTADLGADTPDMQISDMGPPDASPGCGEAVVCDPALERGCVDSESPIDAREAMFHTPRVISTAIKKPFAK